MRSLTIAIALACTLFAAAPAAAKRAPITGTLAKPGYTVVAVGYDGTTTSTKRAASACTAVRSSAATP